MDASAHFCPLFPDGFFKCWIEFPVLTGGPCWLPITVPVSIDLSHVLLYPSPAPFPSGHLKLLSLSVFLFCKSVYFCTFVDSTPMWYHMLSVFNLLAIICSSPDPFVCRKNITLFVFLVWEQYSPGYMYYTICIHSFAGRQCGGFQVLTIEGTATMTLGYMCLLTQDFPSGICPGVELWIMW